MDATPNEEANSPPAADLPSVTRLAAEESRDEPSRHRRKLTDEQGREVTRLYAETDTSVEAIARQFGIGQTSIYRLAQQRGCPCARQPLRAPTRRPWRAHLVAEPGRRGPAPMSKQLLGVERRGVRAR